jgi:hypothetical protein
MSRRAITERPWVARLYAERASALYCRVQVWRTKAAMLAYLNTHHHTIHGNGFGNRTEGACAGWESWRYDAKGRGRKSQCFAEVNLWRGRLGVGVTAHEFFHATMRWAGRVGFDLSQINGRDVTMEEERITYVHGELCRQFVEQGLRPGGVYREADIVKGT